MDNAVTRTWLTQTGGLAWRLRSMRQAAGLSAASLAEATGWAPPKISKLENGRQFPTPNELHQWSQACNADPAVADRLVELLDSSKAISLDFRRQAAQGQLSVQKAYTLLYQASTRILKVETTIIPGPLQTADYARAVLTIAAVRNQLPLRDEHDAARERASRYDLIVDPQRQVELLIWEPVLHLAIGTRDIMLAQLDRLHTIIDHPTVRFGIIPLDAPAIEIPRPFSIFDDLVHIEGQGSTTIEQHPDTTTTYQAIAERLWTMAVDKDNARALILTAAHQHRHRT